MQGPGAPWCVGSGFFPPQCLSTDGPNLFNRFGSCQSLGSTGLLLDEPLPSTNVMQQVQRFIRAQDCPFVPRALLEEHLQSDSSDPRFQGNLLQALKCRDEGFLLFFLCGERANRVGSSLCHRKAGGKCRILRGSVRSHETDGSEEPEWAATNSFQHSVYQLSAVWAHLSANERKGQAIVAARGFYHVHFSAFSIEDKTVQFLSTAVSKFDFLVVHVAWNPHSTEEAAVLLETGVVFLFDVHICATGNQQSTVTLRAKGRLRSPTQRLLEPSCELAMVCHNGEQTQEYGVSESGMYLQNEPAASEQKQANRKFWRCDYGWFPQKLLLVNSQDVFLVDLANETNLLDPTPHSFERPDADKVFGTGIDIIASVGPSALPCSRSLQSTAESIVAFCKAESGEGYQFSVATEHHLFLFDTRQSQTPILRWEHGMREEPPGFLIMCPLSELRSFDDDDKLNGRAILAASRKSGDMRVFCYGSQLENDSKRQKMSSITWGDAIHAWGTPIKMYAPRADADDWKDVFRSCEAQSFRGLYAPRSSENRKSNIAGIAVMPHDSRNDSLKDETKTFTILQLTGLGKLLAQTYKASTELEDPSNASVSSTINASDAEAPIAKKRIHRPLYFEPLPAFLKYIRTGSLLFPFHSERLDRVKEKEVAADAKGLRKDGHQPTVEDALGKHRTGESSGEMLRLNLEPQLMAILKDLKVPMTMYEVARLALGVALPDELAQSPLGVPPDLVTTLQNDPFLSSGASQSNLMSGALEASDHRFSSTKRKVEGRVPVPVLLEVSNLRKVGVDVDPFDGCLPSGDKPTAGGEELLAQSSYRVKGFVETLVLENELTVISLADPTAPWQNDSNGNEDVHSDFLLYTVQTGVPARNRDGNNETERKASGSNDAEGTTNATKKGDIADLESQPSAFGKDVHRKVVARRAVPETNQEPEATKRHLRIDPKLCPIQLSFTSPGEELEQDELTALEDMQADFLQWQQSFSPYKNAF